MKSPPVKLVRHVVMPIERQWAGDWAVTDRALDIPIRPGADHREVASRGTRAACMQSAAIVDYRAHLQGAVAT